ncbi:MAG: hypothetical protein ACD_66C00125G0001 [uncultured bacterium]|nr:MAG: hypothetical protein ACD_66C00125G0001 [uncultured bacterium]
MSEPLTFAPASKNKRATAEVPIPPKPIIWTFLA